MCKKLGSYQKKASFFILVATIVSNVCEVPNPHLASVLVMVTRWPCASRTEREGRAQQWHKKVLDTINIHNYFDFIIVCTSN